MGSVRAYLPMFMTSRRADDTGGRDRSPLDEAYSSDIGREPGQPPEGRFEQVADHIWMWVQRAVSPGLWRGLGVSQPCADPPLRESLARLTSLVFVRFVQLQKLGIRRTYGTGSPSHDSERLRNVQGWSKLDKGSCS